MDTSIRPVLSAVAARCIAVTRAEQRVDEAPDTDRVRAWMDLAEPEGWAELLAPLWDWELDFQQIQARLEQLGGTSSIALPAMPTGGIAALRQAMAAELSTISGALLDLTRHLNAFSAQLSAGGRHPAPARSSRPNGLSISGAFGSLVGRPTRSEAPLAGSDAPGIRETFPLARQSLERFAGLCQTALDRLDQVFVTGSLLAFGSTLSHFLQSLAGGGFTLVRIDLAGPHLELQLRPDAMERARAWVRRLEDEIRAGGRDPLGRVDKLDRAVQTTARWASRSGAGDLLSTLRAVQAGTLLQAGDDLWRRDRTRAALCYARALSYTGPAAPVSQLTDPECFARAAARLIFCHSEQGAGEECETVLNAAAALPGAENLAALAVWVREFLLAQKAEAMHLPTGVHRLSPAPALTLYERLLGEAIPPGAPGLSRFLRNQVEARRGARTAVAWTAGIGGLAAMAMVGLAVATSGPAATAPTPSFTARASTTSSAPPSYSATPSNDPSNRTTSLTGPGELAALLRKATMANIYVEGDGAAPQSLSANEQLSLASAAESANFGASEPFGDSADRPYRIAFDYLGTRYTIRWFTIATFEVVWSEQGSSRQIAFRQRGAELYHATAALPGQGDDRILSSPWQASLRAPGATKPSTLFFYTSRQAGEPATRSDCGATLGSAVATGPFQPYLQDSSRSGLITASSRLPEFRLYRSAVPLLESLPGTGWRPDLLLIRQPYGDCKYGNWRFYLYRLAAGGRELLPASIDDGNQAGNMIIAQQVVQYGDYLRTVHQDERSKQYLSQIWTWNGDQFRYVRTETPPR